MATESMCMGPILCRSRSGECCLLAFFEGTVICPFSCNPADGGNNRQSDLGQGGYSILEMFQTTLVTTLIFNVFNILSTTSATTATTTITTITTTTTTATTALTTMSTTTAPTIISSIYKED